MTLDLTTDGAATSATADAATPADPYDPAWGAFYKRNPHIMRSVGAAAADEGGGDEGGGEEGGGEEGSDGSPGGEGGGAAGGEGDGGGSGGDDDGGGGAQHFSDRFADDDAKKFAARYTTEEEMAKALVNANRELSTRIKPPVDGASEEEVAAFRKTLGVPDTIEGYEISKPEHLEEAEFNDDAMQATIGTIVGDMHKAGATKAVVDAALSAYWSIEAASKQSQTKMDEDAASAAEAALRKEWDKNYDANIALAAQASELYPDLAGLELKDGTLVGSSPHFAKVLATLGRQNAEGIAQLGVINTEAGKDLKGTFDDLTRQIHEAHTNGDKMKAQTLENQRREISEKLYGTGPAEGQAIR